MAWTLTADLDELPGQADAWLARDRVRNTVPLTVLDRMRDGLRTDGALFGWLTDGGQVDGVVLHTPPYALLLADIPPASVTSLAEALREHPLPGVNGPLEQAGAFAAASGRAEAGRVGQFLYRLDALKPPAGAGAYRAAREDDADQAVAWMRAFFAEAEPSLAADDPRPQVEHRIARGELVLLEDGGRPVAMAAFSRPIGGMSRIGPVYTPPDLRRRGYGAEATYGATRLAQEAGADVLVLFTDAANPTSNSIYQALGYRRIGEYVSIAFAAGG